MNEVSLKEIFEGKLIENRYRLLSFLNEGGFGAVFRGHLEIFGEPVREVAIKITKQTGLNYQNAKTVFADAIMLTRIYDGIQDPISKSYIVPIYDMGILPDYHNRGFIVMGLIYGTGSTQERYIPAESLESEIKIYKKGMPPATALKFFERICKGIAAVHGMNIIHRDLKPDNILLTDIGDIRIVDFGLAAGLNTLGYVSGYAGTYRYMAPETLLHGKSSQASDVYSLGIILYEMLTGKYPFESLIPPSRMNEQDKERWILQNKKSFVIDSPSQHNIEVEPWQDALIKICLQYDSNNRFRDAQEILNVLLQKEKHPEIIKTLTLFKSKIPKKKLDEEISNQNVIQKIFSWHQKEIIWEKEVEQLEKARKEGKKDKAWFEIMTKLALCYIFLDKSSEFDPVIDELEKNLSLLESYAEQIEFYNEIIVAMNKKNWFLKEIIYQKKAKDILLYIPKLKENQKK